MKQQKTLVKQKITKNKTLDGFFLLYNSTQKKNSELTILVIENQKLNVLQRNIFKYSVFSLSKEKKTFLVKCVNVLLKKIKLKIFFWFKYFCFKLSSINTQICVSN